MRQRTWIVAAVAAGLMLTGCGQAEPEPAADEVPETEDVSPGDGEQPENGGSGEAEGPRPDPEELAAPCAGHEDRVEEMFITVASPVQEQVVGDNVELVGCSNVFEATVVWNLLDGDGRTLDEGFVTAECGTGCVGAFRDTVSLGSAADEAVVYLQVFAPNMADEGEEQLALTEVLLVRE